MTTPSRERTARKLLQQPSHHPPVGSSAAKRLMYEKQREDGWNNHFLEPLVHDKPRVEPRPPPPKPPNSRQFSEYPSSRKQRKTHLPRKTPPNVRLQPLTPSPLMASPRAPVAKSPEKSDTLRLKAITAIEYRENIIKQLHTILADVPTSPSRHRGAKTITTTQRDAVASVLREMVLELQMAGIRVVEAIVAWVLLVGKSAPLPPVFLWHDANYFVTMHSDMDFLGDALNERGLSCVVGAKSTRQNPLLIEPNQRLGRVYAAQSIITEMVEMSLVSARTNASPDDESALTLLTKDEPVACSEVAMDASTADVEIEPIDEPTGEQPTDEPHDEAASDTEEEAEEAHVFASQDPVHLENESSGLPCSEEDVGSHPSLEAQTKDDEPHDANDDENYADDDFDAHDNQEKPTVDDAPVDAATDEPPPESSNDFRIPAWQNAWLAVGISSSIVEMAAATCTGAPSQPFWVEATDVFPELASTMLTATPPGDQHILFGALLASVDAAAMPVVNCLEAKLSETVDPDNYEDTLEALRDAMDSAWAPPSETQSALDLLTALFDAKAALPPSSMVSKLAHLVFPYLMAAPRAELSDLCRATLEATAPIATRPFLWDATAKVVLLMASVQPPTRELSNLKFVVDRRAMLASTTTALQDHDGSWQALFPFFASESGEKFVNLQRVEAGEGRGPLKEWFALVSEAWAAPFVAVFSGDEGSISVDGRRLTAPPSYLVSRGVRPGWRLCLQAQSTFDIVSVTQDQATIDPPWPRDEVSLTHTDVAWLAPTVPLFKYVLASESYWFNEHAVPSPDHNTALALVGWVLAMALLHQSTISLRLHTAVFCCLLYETPPDRHLFEAVDPALADAWRALHSLPNFAAVLEMDGLVPDTNVDAYIEILVQEKAVAIEWQLNELRRGFYHAMPKAFASCAFTGAQLQHAVCGPPPSETFMVRDIFKVVTDDAIPQAMRTAFWCVVDGLAAAEKRAFVKFVTGVEALPPPQTELLRLEMPWPVATAQEKDQVVKRLPQAHTCENTLELPNYLAGLDGVPETELPDTLATLLRDKLLYAIQHGCGFDLDVAGSIAPATTLEDQGADESSDSMELPTLAVDESATDIPLLQSDAQPSSEEQPTSTRNDTADVALQPEHARASDEHDDEYSFEDFDDDAV
ncbi:hypothetical protein SDRG_02495 [Saprolegnia diclina VS20]|uniref:HECT-type E3 ubiquitin transferase n=1 Tax=Saprolegnia diclina (strain VS20) TaxID=1156394 RepID=T0R2R7_SAPDV|nr:hypothetical protein SDRG_02495 [Saprolegnia diclina VS20]EQC40610.1 hypothetical protein SDRG_02495 [Saprolegnia diclina VS20]|eukprot:XP_008606309.1 hypothetical protein SDRG_02495 [Saprolegnia diclina VS20]